MSQSSIEKYCTEISVPNVFRYAFCFHFVTESNRDQLLAYIISRFEVFCAAYGEVSKNENSHIQGYGETLTEASVKEIKMFKKGGFYRKCLNPNIVKPYAFTKARENMYRNLMYVMKDHEVLHCTLSDDKRRLLEAESSCVNAAIALQNRHKKTTSTYESRMVEWYVGLPLDERPQTVPELCRALLLSGKPSWKYTGGHQDLLKMCRFLLINYGNAGTRARQIDHMVDLVTELDQKI